LLIEKLPFFALSAASSLVTIRAHESLGALASVADLPVSFRLANAVVACALYLRKLVWPVDLSVFYMHPGRWPAGAVIGSALLLLGVTALAVWQWRRRPYLIVGWLWFLGTLVPVLGLVQAHVQAMADRFAYVPAIGVFIMVVWAVADAARQGNHRWTQIHTDQKHSKSPLPMAGIRSPDSEPKQSEGGPESGPQNLCSSVSICGSPLLRYGLAALVLAGCVVVTCLQLRHWRNSVTLLRRVVQVEPGSYLARVMLGNALLERRQLDGALREYRVAQRLRPDDPNAWLHAGVVLTHQGKPTEAMPYLQTAIQLAPGWPEPQRRLALALLRQGKREEARAAFLKLVPLMPATAEGYRDLADMFGEGEQFGEAIRYYREALRLKPDFAAALNNLAMLRASCRQPGFRDSREAVQLAELACRLNGRRNPSFVGTLAAAYAEAGRFSDAVKTIQEAQALARASGADDLLPIQAQMLQQFRAGKPYR
jgi:tetratricopeptide (TPR) repeat protein